MNYLSNEQHPDRLTSVEMSEQIAASLTSDEVPEWWLQNWLAEDGIEVRPSPLKHLDGGRCWEFDVVLVSGVPMFSSEKVQATLRVEIYDDGSADGCVEVSLKVYAPHRA
jgi:hypothetical protein